MILIVFFYLEIKTIIYSAQKILKLSLSIKKIAKSVLT